MNEYTPDKWVIIKIIHDGKNRYLIFACWYGGYLGADEWRLNSGITKVTENTDYYFFEGASGSTYICRKGSYGTSGYGHGVLQNMIEKFKSKDRMVEVLENTINPMELNYE